jgi:hypothetical protein
MAEIVVRGRVALEDIDEGIPGNANWCPLARAVRRAWPIERDYPWVEVYGPGVQVEGIHVWHAETDEQIARFVDDFDAWEPVLPFDFALTFDVISPDDEGPEPWYPE